jgi:RecG-like helicase
MAETSDGFKLAEEDLRLRGPGQFFGSMQHGLPDLKVADVLNDMDICLKLGKQLRKQWLIARSGRMFCQFWRCSIRNSLKILRISNVFMSRTS